jgi:hypothetical protein
MVYCIPRVLCLWLCLNVRLLMVQTCSLLRFLDGWWLIDLMNLEPNGMPIWHTCMFPVLADFLQH